MSSAVNHQPPPKKKQNQKPKKCNQASTISTVSIFDDLLATALPSNYPTDIISIVSAFNTDPSDMVFRVGMVMMGGDCYGKSTYYARVKNIYLSTINNKDKIRMTLVPDKDLRDWSWGLNTAKKSVVASTDFGSSSYWSPGVFGSSLRLHWTLSSRQTPEQFREYERQVAESVPDYAYD